jgi:hypothetical protein
VNEVIGSIKSDATARRMWRFVVRWMVLFFGVCVVWFVVAATQHLIAPMSGSRGRSITDEFPPVTESGIVLAVCMVITFQFGLLNHVPTSDIDTTNLTMERIAAWIVGTGLFVFSWVLTFTVEIGSGISPLAAWALKSVSS